MKIEIVITVWEDGLFKLRDRVEANDTDLMEEQIEIVINSIKEKLAELNRKKYSVGEDDDIPF